MYTFKNRHLLSLPLPLSRCTTKQRYLKIISSTIRQRLKKVLHKFFECVCERSTCFHLLLETDWISNLPESINALTGNPLTLQLIYNITTVPKVSGLYSIAASIFASIFFCLISSAISRCASVSKGSAFIILSRCACRSSRAAICSLSTVENLSIMHEYLDQRCKMQH